MTDWQRGFNDGLEEAATILQKKAIKMREAANVTAETMAKIFEDEAATILAAKEIN